MERTEHYNYAFLDEGSKREIRRCILKAVAIPGYQVPFGSRELPIDEAGELVAFSSRFP